jgi:hypothetical protein
MLIAHWPPILIPSRSLYKLKSNGPKESPESIAEEPVTRMLNRRLILRPYRSDRLPNSIPPTGLAAVGMKPMTEAQKGVNPQSLAVESMAKENKKRLPVAGRRPASNTRSTCQDLSPASLRELLSSIAACIKGIPPGSPKWVKIMN